MPTTINGTTGVSQVQDGTITTAKVVDGSIQTADIADSAVTAPKLSGAQTGAAPIYGARAWCRFDGTLTGTNAPAAGGNVTSVTRVSAGVYDVNLTTAMQDTNYCVAVTGRIVGAQSAGSEIRESCTTTTVRVSTFNTNSGVSGDATSMNVAIFR